MNKVNLKDIDSLPFWTNYFGCCYPDGYDEEEDVSASELMQELYTEETRNWWDTFTGYYDGVLDESDGYLEEPATLETALPEGKTLKIEFHPGDILYFINDEQAGSTGPHCELQTIPYSDVEQLLSLENGRLLFLLLLPLAYIDREESKIEPIRKNISQQMQNYFPEDLCQNVSKCIVAGLIMPEE